VCLRTDVMEQVRGEAGVTITYLLARDEEGCLSREAIRRVYEYVARQRDLQHAKVS
jgi:hypothetical protein